MTEAPLSAPVMPDGGSEAAPLPPGPVLVDASFIVGVLRGDVAPLARAASGVLERSVLLSVTCAEVIRVMYRLGAVPATVVTEGLSDLGVRVVDFPAAAGEHIPALVAMDRAADQRAQREGTRRAQLSLGDLCVLGYAIHAGLPTLGGDRHWATLRPHGLEVPLHFY